MNDAQNQKKSGQTTDQGWLKPGWIDRWEPEDATFWESTGKKIAIKNLVISIPALHLAFLVWLLWSAIVVNMNSVGFDFTIGELFWLTAIPGLTGPTLRIGHSFLPSLIGGWLTHMISVGSLLIPLVWLFYAIQDSSTPWSTFMLIGALAGFGGGNFASSMSNISSFFPTNRQGLALGLNAGVGNLGVSTVQLITPLIIGVGIVGSSVVYNEGKFVDGEWITTAGGVVKDVWLQSGLLIWIVPTVIVLLAAIFFMNSLRTFSLPFKEQMGIFKLKHT